MIVYVNVIYVILYVVDMHMYSIDILSIALNNL